MDKEIVDMVYKTVLDKISKEKFVFVHKGILNGYHHFEAIILVDRDTCSDSVRNKLIELI